MKDYLNMTELMEEIKKRSETQIYSENKIREKLLELFKVMHIRTEFLQEGRKTTGEYRFPVESIDFLCYLYDFYTTADGKNFRRGEFEKIDLDVIRNIIGRMMDMLKLCDLTQEEISEQEIIIWQATRFIYLSSRDEIRQQIENLKLDFFPKTKEIYGRRSGDPDHPVIQKKSRFRYSLTDLDSVDMYYFFDFVLEDMKKSQAMYRKIYENMVTIRSREIEEVGYKVDELFSDEDADKLLKDADKATELMGMLYKDPEYDRLAERYYELTHSNEFLKKKDKELLELSERMRQIEKEYADKYFKGEIEDFDSKFDMDYQERDPEDVLNQAIREYEERQAMIEKISAMIDKKILQLEEQEESEQKEKDI